MLRGRPAGSVEESDDPNRSKGPAPPEFWLADDLELLDSRSGIGHAARPDGLDLQDVLAEAQLRRLERRGAWSEPALVELACEGRPGLVGGELELRPALGGLLLRALGDRGVRRRRLGRLDCEGASGRRRVARRVGALSPEDVAAVCERAR